jgi:hypothetical protein
MLDFVVSFNWQKLKPLIPTYMDVKFCGFILLTETEVIVSNPHKC